MSPLGWFGIVRLGLVQAAIGAMVVLVTSTMNRVMVVEYRLPAMVPGALVALHYIIQVVRPRLGFGSDMGRRRTPWILGGLGALAAGAVGAAWATGMVAAHPWLGVAAAIRAYLAVGLGVGAAGTSLLALMAQRVAPRRRAAAAAVVWLMMIAGIAIAAGSSGALLDPFSPSRLLAVTSGISAVAVVIAALGIWGIEGAATAPTPGARTAFLPALREVWAERQARRFAQFVFVSMLAYSAQELVLEPFVGAVFGRTPGQSASVTGLQHAAMLVGMAVVAVGTMLARDARATAMQAWTIGGCGASAAGMLALAACSVAGPDAPLRASVALLGAANGAFAVSAIGAMMGLAGDGRDSRAGTRMGIWGAAQALAFGAGGLAGSAASDAARALLGSPSVAYGAVYVAGSVLFVAAAWLAAGVFRADVFQADRRSAAPAGAIATR